jgi:acyl-coenzyme A thioesterase PaaI-like protein
MSVAENGEGAVTSNLNTTFMRRPKPAAVIAEARLIRCGKRLAYGEVTMFSEGDQEPVAHATGTYALPPEKFR